MRLNNQIKSAEITSKKLDQRGSLAVIDEFNNVNTNQENEVVYPEQYFKNMPVGMWVKVHPTGEIFSPRTGHECIFADGNIYLFGGTDDEERLNDLYQYSIRKNRW